jgi:uncharacterized protein YodC (DUF2158 family)
VKLGDVVTLKSGSPKMTIDSIHTNGQVCNCVWFAGTEQKSGSFALATLTPAS